MLLTPSVKVIMCNIYIYISVSLTAVPHSVYTDVLDLQLNASSEQLMLKGSLLGLILNGGLPSPSIRGGARKITYKFYLVASTSQLSHRQDITVSSQMFIVL